HRRRQLEPSEAPHLRHQPDRHVHRRLLLHPSPRPVRYPRPVALLPARPLARPAPRPRPELHLLPRPPAAYLLRSPLAHRLPSRCRSRASHRNLNRAYIISMTERKKFIDDYLTGEFTVTELCSRYGISRKTGHKWIRRFMDHCELGERSSRPHHSPKAVPAWVEDAIVRARRQKPKWGPRKLRDALRRANPGAELPSVSTFALIFRRNGLIRPKRRKRKTPPFSAPLAHAKAPNQVWCIDFKGHFAVGSTRCYPLTITDAYSRFLIACVALSRPDGKRVRKVMEQVFDEFGLPDAIRSDNGTPFASSGVAGLSQLSTWWWKLGIRHERIQPGKPQQNGRHERMHLTLAQETASPPSANLKAQQRAFDRFRKEYNCDRPHEA